MTNLDVLVVYSSDLAQSASLSGARNTNPFSLSAGQNHYQLSYAHFLRTCRDQSLSAGFTTSADIIAPGTCSNYWKFRAGEWIKVQKEAHSQQIFDKISPNSPQRAAERSILLADDSIQTFNDRELHRLFFDKLITHRQLLEYTVPTVAVQSADVAAINRALKKLNLQLSAQSPNPDFARKYVLKDRYGAGGDHVYEIKVPFARNIGRIMRDNPAIQFVLQPFVLFDQGFAYQSRATATDIRLIFNRNVLIQCYLRLAKPDEFRCNEHKGGELIYVDKADIPEKILLLANKMVKQIDKPRSLYALDFVVGNSGRPYCIEGNTGPGLDWDIKKKVNEKMSKQLIQNIVDEFGLRIKISVRSRVITAV